MFFRPSRLVPCMLRSSSSLCPFAVMSLISIHRGMMIVSLFVGLLLASSSSLVVAVMINNNDYDESGDGSCICALLERPNVLVKAKRARWMVHSLNFGILSTISSRLPGNPPFGNVISFVDGLCETSTGVPYFYGTYRDQSFMDAQKNPSASLTLSEASLPSLCTGTHPIKACASYTGRGDPENPVCARLNLTGKLVEVKQEENPAEYEMAQAALFQRHPVMPDWPENHHWIVAKLEIEDIWFIDYFGGPSILPVEEYLAVDLFRSLEVENADDHDR
ncbi:hypothetical protein ACA910_012135 [Epithemia clementina (nom. ined.)]